MPENKTDLGLAQRCCVNTARVILSVPVRAVIDRVEAGAAGKK